MSQECLVSFGDALVSCGNALVSFDDDRMPPHCVMLEYFQEGFRRGSKAVQDIFTSIETASPTTFNASSSPTFRNSVPFARFNGSTNINFPNIYSMPTELFSAEGFAVEYWGRQSSTNGWVRKYMTISKPDNSYPYHLMPSYTSALVIGYSPTSGGWWWGSKNGLSSSWTNWHHIVHVVKNGILRTFFDDVCSHEVSDWYSARMPLGINLSAYLCDANSYGTKYGYYDICQLTVWDYPKYWDNFSVPDMLYIDTI